MSELALLLAAYGLAFFITHKLNFLDGRLSLLDRMMECSFCMGFHTGWITYLLSRPDFGEIEWSLVPLWAFASAAFSYGADTALLLAESRTQMGKNNES